MVWIRAAKAMSRLIRYRLRLNSGMRLLIYVNSLLLVAVLIVGGPPFPDPVYPDGMEIC